MTTVQQDPAERQQHADRVAAEYERWSWGEGYQAGRVDGGRDGWRDGYTHGFDTGAEIGGARVLLELRGALGDDVIDEALASGHLPHTSAYDDYRSRSTYEPPADHREWVGTENGAQLPAWSATDDDGMDL